MGVLREEAEEERKDEFLLEEKVESF